MTETTWRTTARTIERAIRQAIVGVFLAGVRQRNPGAVVNAAVSLAVTYFPDLVEWKYGVEFRPWQRLYAGTAMLTHAVGMLGPYDDEGWWDHVTHTMSSSILAGVAHAAARRRGRDPRPRVLGLVVAGGVFWELLEYAVHAVSRRIGIEPLLVPYSKRDTLFDLCFNLLGALLVLVFGDRLLENLTEE